LRTPLPQKNSTVFGVRPEVMVGSMSVTGFAKMLAVDDTSHREQPRKEPCGLLDMVEFARVDERRQATGAVVGKVDVGRPLTMFRERQGSLSRREFGYLSDPVRDFGAAKLAHGGYFSCIGESLDCGGVGVAMLRCPESESAGGCLGLDDGCESPKVLQFHLMELEGIYQSTVPKRLAVLFENVPNSIVETPPIVPAPPRAI
jgi:hypothetical protein